MNHATWNVVKLSYYYTGLIISSLEHTAAAAAAEARYKRRKNCLKYIIWNQKRKAIIEPHNVGQIAETSYGHYYDFYFFAFRQYSLRTKKKVDAIRRIPPINNTEYQAISSNQFSRDPDTSGVFFHFFLMPTKSIYFFIWNYIIIRAMAKAGTPGIPMAKTGYPLPR